MIRYLAYLSIGFISFQFLNVLLNLLFRQRIGKTVSPSDEMVSVLIPARDEAHNIGFLLDDLSKIRGTNLEIIIFDDQSTDDTCAVVERHASSDPRIQLIRSESTLPEGWLGKNHACYQLAKQAKGSYYLFIDADVRIEGNIISDALAYLKKHQLGLLSIFPVQILKSRGEKITVPMMNYILLTLLPLIFVRVSPFPSHSAANGQFMFFDALTYRKTQPHKHLKSSHVEDIAIARYFKKQRIKIACTTHEERIQCRMYQSYGEALSGFSKNIIMFFGNKRLLALLFALFTALGFLPVLMALPTIFPLYLVVL
ncbi:MAG: glycosyl transferase, partial [Bacteroidetes bacterium]